MVYILVSTILDVHLTINLSVNDRIIVLYLYGVRAQQSVFDYVSISFLNRIICIKIFLFRNIILKFDFFYENKDEI